jgi:hypothetical protein
LPNVQEQSAYALQLGLNACRQLGDGFINTRCGYSTPVDQGMRHPVQPEKIVAQFVRVGQDSTNDVDIIDRMQQVSRIEGRAQFLKPKGVDTPEGRHGVGSSRAI